VDTLVALGASISSEDHIDVILDGLSDDYDHFITIITSKTNPYTVDEIEVVLLAQEERLGKHKLTQSYVIQANIVSIP